jgi:GNAT superfamily N-acetyltransferase
MIVGDEVETRLYRPGDEGGIVGLLEDVFGGWPGFDITCSPLEYWRWKYEAVRNSQLISVSRYKDRIVGCHHSTIFDLKVGDGFYKGTYGTDLAVLPEFRGRRLSRRLVQMVDERRSEIGVDYAMILASNPLNIRSISKRSPSTPFDLVNLVRIGDIDRQIEAIPVKNSEFIKLGFRVSRLLNKMANLVSRSRPSNTMITTVDRFDGRVNDLWEMTSKEYDLIVRRDEAYLNWRYCDHRSGRFLIRQAQEGEQILGYTVLSVNSTLEGYPVGFIVDLLTAPSREDVADALVSDAVAFFEGAGVNVVNFLTVRKGSYQGVLSGHGFLDSRIPFHLFYKTYTEEDYISVLRGSNPKRMHFSWGDHDTLPVKAPQY